MTVINPKVAKWFERRKITRETLDEAGVYSGAWAEDEETGLRRVVGAEAGDVIVFPYIERGQAVNEKYRSAGKRFSQKAGGKKTFFNSDVLDLEPLKADDFPLVITEGEMDCLSLLEAGFKYAMSVPDGAPPARDAQGNLIEVPEDTADIDINDDDKFGYVVNNWGRLTPIKRIIIATDADEPGQRLAAELVRRLGRARCLHVEYPRDEVVLLQDGTKRACKDLNEVLMEFGPKKVREIIDEAKAYPVSGVYELSEFPAEPNLVMATTGWGSLDENLRVYYPCFMVVTGLAGIGKSTWTMQLVSHLAMRHGWKAAVASFEMRLDPYVTHALMAPYIGGPRAAWTPDDVDRGKTWLQKNFIFIAPHPQDDSAHDIDWLIERARVAVLRKGIRVLLIDPWNEIEHSKARDETMGDYVGRAIRKLKTFAREYEVLVIVVAHPTKSGSEKGPDRVSLYDVSDSAHFANKADMGIVISREDKASPITTVVITKVRYQPEAGKPANLKLEYNDATRCFDVINPDAPARSPYEPRGRQSQNAPLPMLPPEEDGDPCPF